MPNLSRRKAHYKKYHPKEKEKTRPSVSESVQPVVNVSADRAHSSTAPVASSSFATATKLSATATTSYASSSTDVASSFSIDSDYANTIDVQSELSEITEESNVKKRNRPIEEEIMENEECDRSETDLSSEDEVILVSKKRLKQIIEGNCSCICNMLSETKGFAFDSDITTKCEDCRLVSVSPSKLIAKENNQSYYENTLKLVYDSLINNEGYAGVRDKLGLFGKKNN